MRFKEAENGWKEELNKEEKRERVKFKTTVE